MEWVEITARTVEEATDHALDRLGVDEQDAEIQIVEEPRPGLFGRMRGEARIRARVAPREARPKQERRGDGRRRGAKSGAGGVRDAKKATDAGSTGSPDAPSDGSAAVAAAAADTVPAAEEGSSARRRRSGGSKSSPADSSTTRSASGSTEEGPVVVANPLSIDEHTKIVEEFVTGLVGAFGAEATYETVEIDESTREVRVIGDDLGHLIGPRGNTLQAVQELARTVVHRHASEGQAGRVFLDIGGYRERRRGALERFTTKVAGDVLESGVAKALEPMAASDRKVVHDTANEIEGVRTTSEGEEPRRRVVLHPDAD